VTDYHPSDPGAVGGPGDDEDVTGPSERFLAAMSLAETPEQQAVAREIFQRLEEGAEVDDIKDLLERQMKVVVAQRNGCPVASAADPEPAGPTGVVGGAHGSGGTGGPGGPGGVGGPGRQRGTGGDGPGSGLGARPEGNRRDW
jgi:hypothetical protein